MHLKSSSPPPPLHNNRTNFYFPFLFSLWLCTFSLAVTIVAALLLPISIVSNEVLLLYPRSYYVKWLNSSLVHGTFLFLSKNHLIPIHQIYLCIIFVLLRNRFVESRFFVLKSVTIRTFAVLLFVCGIIWILRSSERNYFAGIRDVYRFFLVSCGCTGYNLYRISCHLSRKTGPPNIAE